MKAAPALRIVSPAARPSRSWAAKRRRNTVSDGRFLVPGSVHSTGSFVVASSCSVAPELSFRPTGTNHRVLTDDAITAGLVGAIGQKARKLVARMAGACERTVAEWCLGRRLPSAGHLLRLIQQDRDVRIAMLGLACPNLSPTLRNELRVVLLHALRLLDEGRE